MSFLRRMRHARSPAGLTAVAALAAAGCGSSSTPHLAVSTAPAPPGATTKVEVVKPGSPSAPFNAAAIYKREAPGVVTVESTFGTQRGLGSGFVIASTGEIATNAHVVTNGTGAAVRPAKTVYINFSDGNQVPARVVGFDPNADVALLHVNPAGLTLRPLPLGVSRGLVVGSPVAAIGSPFGEAQSLSTGVISATGRSIDSLTGFQISGAIQTDAAINHGNSGGPLVNAAGQVLGINSQIASSSGGGEGVGFSVPVDTVKRSLDQLRRTGKVRYAYLGVSSVGVFPQLARRLGLQVTRGAFIQTVVPGGPAAQAGITPGTKKVTFQSQQFTVGGDIVTKVDGRPIRLDTDLGDDLASKLPGQSVSLEVVRGAATRTVAVRLGERPLNSPSPTPRVP